LKPQNKNIVAAHGGLSAWWRIAHDFARVGDLAGQRHRDSPNPAQSGETVLQAHLRAVVGFAVWVLVLTVAFEAGIAIGWSEGSI
jgi:hypothetical protein